MSSLVLVNRVRDGDRDGELEAIRLVRDNTHIEATTMSSSHFIKC